MCSVQAMNFGAMLPDVKASLPIPGQRIRADLHASERNCVPGIEADCSHVPFASIMVRLSSVFPALLHLQNPCTRRKVQCHVEQSSAHHCQTQRLRSCIAHKGSSSTPDHSVALPVVPQLVAALCHRGSIALLK